MNVGKGNLKCLETAQHQIICGAFSMSPNTSRTRLRVLGSLESMEVRVKILSERFRIRVISLTLTGKSFLGFILSMLGHGMLPIIGR
mgnify:CR=1 FL=1